MLDPGSLLGTTGHRRPAPQQVCVCGYCPVCVSARYPPCVSVFVCVSQNPESESPPPVTEGREDDMSPLKQMLSTKPAAVARSSVCVRVRARFISAPCVTLCVCVHVCTRAYSDHSFQVIHTLMLRPCSLSSLRNKSCGGEAGTGERQRRWSRHRTAEAYM